MGLVNVALDKVNMSTACRVKKYFAILYCPTVGIHLMCVVLPSAAPFIPRNLRRIALSKIVMSLCCSFFKSLYLLPVAQATAIAARCCVLL